MYGLVPSGAHTLEVMGDFHVKQPIEGRLYWDPETKYLYFHSKSITRPNPDTGYFPIWDGNGHIYQTQFSRQKKYPDDVLIPDTNILAAKMTKEMADKVRYYQKRMDRDRILTPNITAQDNMFTQCIKGIINQMKVTMIDLHQMSTGITSEKMIENYYNFLNSTTMMRQDKWNIWLAVLKMTYSIDVYDNNNVKLLSYNSETDILDAQETWGSNIKEGDDPLTRIAKVLIQMKSINKASLQRPEIDSYAVNNLFTAINGSKALSAQLFSRFIRMANMSYDVTLYKDGETYFNFHE